MSTFSVTFEDWSGKSHTVQADRPQAIARAMSVHGYTGPAIPITRPDGSTFGFVSADKFEYSPEEIERLRVEAEARRMAAIETIVTHAQRLETRAFLVEIEAVCRKHGLSISHEDCGGSFVVHEWNETDSRWLAEAREEIL